MRCIVFDLTMNLIAGESRQLLEETLRSPCKVPALTRSGWFFNGDHRAPVWAKLALRPRKKNDDKKINKRETEKEETKKEIELGEGIIIKFSGGNWRNSNVSLSRTSAAASLLAVNYGRHVTPEVAWLNGHHFFPTNHLSHLRFYSSVARSSVVLSFAITYAKSTRWLRQTEPKINVKLEQFKRRTPRQIESKARRGGRMLLEMRRKGKGSKRERRTEEELGGTFSKFWSGVGIFDQFPSTLSVGNLVYLLTRHRVASRSPTVCGVTTFDVLSQPLSILGRIFFDEIMKSRVIHMQIISESQNK